MNASTIAEVDEIYSSNASIDEKRMALIDAGDRCAWVGNRPVLLHVCNRLTQLGGDTQDVHSTLWGGLLRGLYHMQSNELEVAEQCFIVAQRDSALVNDVFAQARALSGLGRLSALQGNHSLAEERYDAALTIAIETADVPAIARAFNNYMFLFDLTQDFSGQKEIIERVLPHFLSYKGQHYVVARALKNAGLFTMVHSTDVQKGIDLAQRSLDMSIAIKDKHGECLALGLLATGYWYLGDAGRSIELYNKDFIEAEKLGDELFLALELVNGAYPYMLIDDYTKVLELNRRALDIYERHNKTQDSAWAELGIGTALLNLGKPGEAIEALRRSAELNETQNDWHGSGYSYYRWAEALLAMGEYEEALEKFNVALDFRRRAISLLEVSDTQTQRGRLLIRFGNISDAILALKEALEIAETIPAKVQIHRALRALADAYSAAKDINSAYEFLQRYVAVGDEIVAQESAKKVASLEYLHRIEMQKQQHDATTNLLNKVLPARIADRVLNGERIADKFSNISILFADIVGFTPIAAQMSADAVVEFLNAVFASFDTIVKKYGCEKIKTIGDGYMVVAGAPDECEDHAERIVRVALELMEGITLPDHVRATLPPHSSFHIRIGLNCGPAIAGIIGEDRFVYDVYSDAVNLAARMESSGEPGRIQCTEEFMKHVRERRISDNTEHHFAFTLRGEIEVKGKGMMRTYYVEQA